jgi:phosphatidylinositol kinase/protein kinase (PI-3  family)
MVNQQHLKQVWNTDGVVNPADWRNWLKRLGLEFMRESPSQALRSCAALAEVHVNFGQDLFNVAFVSCWTELYESYQVRISALSKVFAGLPNPRIFRMMLSKRLRLPSRPPMCHPKLWCLCLLWPNSWSTTKGHFPSIPRCWVIM